MADPAQFSVQLRLLDGYKFEIDFGDAGQLFSDEPAPLGEGTGPNPSRLLAAAVANCLAASLLFSVRKFKEDPGPVTAEVRGELERQDGRLRISKLQVDLQLGHNAVEIPHLERALSQFENFCVVTQSVRQGIEVSVQVLDSDGQLVHQG
ncbi:OsmC family protein [Rheinheimera sp.]|jgi:organic hydroperoxide reductase OsmC/OhrA|uniref:OsmC family protein n=1 Tax=Rheinheimera sp. TaxID=1869214 RepID=UPI003D2B4DC8